MDAADLECVVVGCPALQELNLTYSYNLIDCELTGLGRLTGLTKLCIEGGKQHSYSWASSVGAQLTRLQELELTAAAFSFKWDKWLSVPEASVDRPRVTTVLQLESLQEACCAMQVGPEPNAWGWWWWWWWSLLMGVIGHPARSLPVGCRFLLFITCPPPC
jgi:hypothetical protein